MCQPGLKHDLRTILVLLLLPLLLPITTTATASDIYTLLSSFSSTGSIPFGVAVDRNGNVFVCNSYSNNVAKFDNSGNLLTVFGSYGSGPSQLYYNTGIAVDGSGYVFVTSYLGDRIEKFDNNGNFVTEWTPGFEPTGIAVDSNGNVFVAEESGFVEKFDNNGNFITRWSGYSYGIAVDPNGNVFVSAAGSLITKYDNNGNYISSFYANGSAYFMASDANGNIYVAEFGAGQVEKFDNNGIYLSTISTPYTYPDGVAVDPNGNLFVADYFADVVEKFAQVPSTLPTFVPNANLNGGSLSLAVTDTVAGVNSTTYSLDGGAFQSYLTPIAINDGLLHIVLYQSSDTAGNVEDLQSFYFSAAPVALGLSPDHVPTGNGPTLLTVSGTGFDANCVICIDGHALSTTFVDANNVQATLSNFTGNQPHVITVTDRGVTPHRVSNHLILRVGKPRLAVSAVLSRDGSNNVVATLTLKNTGPIGSDATGVTLNTATLTNLTTSASPVSPTSPTLPYGVSTVTAGSSQTITLTFPPDVGTTGQTVRVAFQGVYDGGTFSVSGQKKLP